MVLTILCLFPTLSVLGFLMNNPRQYKYERFISAPFRYYVSFFVINLAASFATMLAQKEYMKAVGTMAGLCLLVTDMMVDLAMVLSFYTDTKYKVVEELGHGVMLCQREEKVGSITTKEAAKAELDSKIENTKEKKALQETELAGIKTALLQLHANCDFLVENYDVRKEARVNEIEGLKNAKSVLSGANFS